jgi:flagellar biosynthesis chaperone FliJ
MRTRRKRTTKSIDSKIEAAKQNLERAKARYEKAAKTLETLMNERDEIRKRELLEAIGKSDRTYEEILNFIRG